MILGFMRLATNREKGIRASQGVEGNRMRVEGDSTEGVVKGIHHQRSHLNSPDGHHGPQDPTEQPPQQECVLI